MSGRPLTRVLRLLIFSVLTLAICLGGIVATIVFESTWSVRKVINDSADKDSVKILFVGDSFLFVNSLPAVLSQLIEKGAHRSTRIWQIVGPSYTWETHWQRGVAQQAISEALPWNYVVLQGEPLWNPPHFQKYGLLFGDLIKAHGAQPVLFEEWSDRASSSDQEKINAANYDLSAKSKMLLEPIGELWTFAAARTNIKLYGEDNVHPSQAGTYLSACALYESLLQLDPRGLPSHLYAPHSVIQLVDLPQNEALQLQTIVYDFFKSRAGSDTHLHEDR